MKNKIISIMVGIILIATIIPMIPNVNAEGINWVEATAHAGWAPRTNGYGLLTFDNKMWIMGGYAYNSSFLNDVWSSSDGITWTEATAHANWTPRVGLSALVYDNKMWVMGGYDATGPLNDTWYSTDGANWIQATANAAWSKRYIFQSTVYNNKIWIMGGADATSPLNETWYSTDGVNWIEATAHADWTARTDFRLEVYNNKMWIMGGSDWAITYNDTWYSTDGINWNEATANANWSARAGFASSVFENRLWVMGGYGPEFNAVWYSTDGATWHEATAHAQWSPRFNFAATVYDKKLWVIGGYNYSGDFLNDVWYDPMPIPATINITLTPSGTANIIVNPTFWNPSASIGGNTATATDAFTLDNNGTIQVDVTVNASNTSAWTLGSSPAYNQFQMQYGVSGGGTPAGVNWNETKTTDVDTSIVRDRFSPLSYDGKLWQFGGYVNGQYRNDVWYSTDNITWTEATAHAAWTNRQNYGALVYDNKMWILGGSGNKNDVWYSTDGANWTQATASAGWTSRQSLSATVFDDKMWVMGGSGGGTTKYNDVWYSTDGATWTQATAHAGWSARYALASISYDGKLWVFGGYTTTYKNDVWYSTDGTNWTQATASANWSARRYSSAFVYDGKMWILEGSISQYANARDAWYSTDGVNWTEATSDIPVISTMSRIMPTPFIVHGSSMVAVYDDKVWVSTDSVTWAMQLNTTDWLTRAYHRTIVFNNKIWLMGGYTQGQGGINLNDIWSSTDGQSWKLEKNDAAWSPRTSFSLVSFDDKLWLYGGYTTDIQNDAWYSTDGVNWTQTTNMPFTRSEPACLVFDNKIWLMGGSDTDGIYYNDTWYSTDGSNWTLATSNSGWAPRSSFSGFVYADKMWIVGGAGYNPDSICFNDVWCSSDGVNWTEKTAHAGFSERYEQLSFVYDGKMWVVGGGNFSVWAVNDVWSSTDGITWTEVAANANWSLRICQSFVIYQNKILVMGGMTGDNVLFNDVWYTEGSGGSASWSNLGVSPVAFVSNLAWDQSQPFGLQLFMPTSSSTATNQTAMITFIATMD